MHDKLEELKTRLQEINDLDMAASLLDWDQSTYMPSGGAAARARQLATLARLSQEKLVDSAMGTLLDQLVPWAEEQPYDSNDASLIRVVYRDYEQVTKIPTNFLAELSEHSALSYQAWAEARPENDFIRLQPILEKTLDSWPSRICLMLGMLALRKILECMRLMTAMGFCKMSTGLQA